MVGYFVIALLKFTAKSISEIILEIGQHTFGKVRGKK